MRVARVRRGRWQPELLAQKPQRDTPSPKWSVTPFSVRRQAKSALLA